MSNLQKLHAEWVVQRDKYPILKDWKLRIDARAKTRAGCCKHSPREICISRWHLLNGHWDAVRDTLLHEIAHALVGPGHKHNYFWQEMARKVGATPRACFSSNDPSMGLKLHHRIVCFTHGDIGGYTSKRKWMNIPDCGGRWCRKCRGPIAYVYSHSGDVIPHDKIPNRPVTAQPKPAPQPVPVMARFFPAPTPQPMPIAARQPVRSSTGGARGGKTFTYACVAPDGVRCTNGIGSRERRMGIDVLLKRLPRPMTKDEAKLWLRDNA